MANERVLDEEETILLVKIYEDFVNNPESIYKRAEGIYKKYSKIN